MKFIRLIKANKEWSVHKTDNRQKPYWYISGPNGVYKDADGNTYKFDSYEDALEEVEYLKAEHKYDKKASSNSLNISNEVSMATGIIDEIGGFSSDEESPQDFVDTVKNIARKINNFLDTLDGDQFNVGNLKEATWQFSDRAWASSDDFEECLDDLQYEFSNEGINLII